MLFYLLCIYVSLYYIRPFEWYGPLRGVPIFSSLGIVCLLALFFCWATGKIRLFSYKTDYMVTGFILAMILSHLSHGYFGGAINSVVQFLPSFVGYFLVAHGLDSRQKIDRFVLLLIFLTTFLGYEAWLQYFRGFSHGGLEPIYQHFTDMDGVRVKMARVRWYGPFNDPNDLGLALVLPVPFLLNRLWGRKYLFAGVCLLVLLTGLYLTNSRGAMLALLASAFAYLVLRYRNTKGVVVGVALAVVLMVFGPSRMAQLSAGEESAYGRIEAWYEGFQMFKAFPVFGVGKGMFTDYNSLTAHNSFMLVLAEMGAVGSFFFLGMFFYPFRWAKRTLFKASEASPVDGNWFFLAACFGSLVGLLAAMFFLSRSYILLPFMLVALATAAIYGPGGAAPPGSQEGINDDFGWSGIFGLLVAEIIGINLLVKLML